MVRGADWGAQGEGLSLAAWWFDRVWQRLFARWIGGQRRVVVGWRVAGALECRGSCDIVT